MAPHLPRWSVLVAATGLVSAVGQLSPAVASSAVLVPTVVAVSAGANHTCAVTDLGGVTCWGRNFYGELGDGTTTDRLTPTDVTGLSTGVAAVATGLEHSCALTTLGAVKCWGWNKYGQLGDGTRTRQLTPVAVSGLTSGVLAIAAGSNHTCALLATGGVQCWGQNDSGQLGDGTLAVKSVPVDVSGLTSGVAAITTSEGHTCAVMTLGGAKCWGSNRFSELGDGTTKRAKVPVDVRGLTGAAVGITAGENHTCALMTGGGVQCWGANASGQLGDGTTKNRRTPTDVAGLTSVSTVSAGSAHTCALSSSGEATCWGDNSHGQLGSGAGSSSTPVGVIGLANATTAISAGGANGCATTSDGSARCWGDNSYGQIGDSTRARLAQRRVPMTVWGLTGGTTGTFRPDLLTAAAARGPYRGDGVYNASGAKQTIALRLPRATIKHAYLRLQSDGASDIVFLLGTGFGTAHSKVGAHCSVGTADVTLPVGTGNSWNRVRSTQNLRLSLAIHARATAVIGSQRVITILARSSHDPSKLDVSKIIVTVVR